MNSSLRKLNPFVYLIFTCLASYAILSRIWVTEDAYITFKYIENFFAGNGLVFVPGEYVEGFTHPLWAFFLIIIKLFQFNLHFGSILLGLIFTSLGLVLSIRYFYKEEKFLLLFPTLLIVNNGFRDFSTSGMEFSLTFFLLVLLLSKISNRSLHSSPISIFSILALLYLNRPEFGLLIPFYGLSLFFEKNKDLNRTIIKSILPVLILAGGYHIFRYFYYDDFLPNTFYAKSGSGSNFPQGWLYLKHFSIYSHLLIPYLLLFVFVKTKEIFKKQFISESFNYFFYRDIIASFLLAFYIIRVGGDFMAFRLLLPSFVMLNWIISDKLNLSFQKLSLHSNREIIINAFNFILIFVGFCYIIYYKNTPLIKNFIINERLYYTDGLYESKLDLFNEIQYKWYDRGLEFKKFQECIDYEPFLITNSVTGAKCYKNGFGLGYVSVAAGSKVGIIDEQGLTDRHIAKQPRSEVFRTGHERTADLDYLISRGVLFCNTGEIEYDKNMRTNQGVIINLDPNFLKRLTPEDFKRKIQFLENYKNINPKLINKLEKARNIGVEELKNVSSELTNKYNKCWK